MDKYRFDGCEMCGYNTCKCKSEEVTLPQEQNKEEKVIPYSIDPNKPSISYGSWKSFELPDGWLIQQNFITNRWTVSHRDFAEEAVFLQHCMDQNIFTSFDSPKIAVKVLNEFRGA